METPIQPSPAVVPPEEGVTPPAKAADGTPWWLMVLILGPCLFLKFGGGAWLIEKLLRSLPAPW